MAEKKEKKYVSDNPQLMAEWNWEKNIDADPTKITIGSHKKVWWKCSEGHEWEAIVKDRNRGNGCPFCSGKKRIKGVNDLQTVNPDLAKEWNYDKNGKLTPMDVSHYSDKKVWWKCSEGHEWQATISNRTIGRGCPYCSNKKAIKGKNDLQTVYPFLAREWNYEKNNGLTPSDVLPNSNKKVWWKCKKGHEWLAKINDRTNGTGCPTCSSERRTSFPEYVIAYYLEKHGTKVVHSHREFGYELDLYIPSKRIAIEYDGGYWHKDRKENDLEKNARCKRDGIKLYRIREGLLPLNSTSIDFIINKDQQGFLQIVEKLLVEIIGTSIEYDVDIDRDTIAIENLREYTEKQNSIVYSNPEIVSEWNYEKNGNLRPENFAPNSEKKVWWKCSKGHEWRATISNRHNGNGCPYCSGTYVIKGCNDLQTINPVLASEWNYEKNDGLTPTAVLPNSNKKVWWRCQKGHEWQAMIQDRNKGGGCPYCSNKKALKGYNDLQTINPSLASEWNYEKNNRLTPADVLPHSNKKVWWKCSEGHEWQVTINNRSNGNGCPYCAGQRLIQGINDLQTLNPILAEEWNYERNGELTPVDIMPHSNKKVWWKCSKGHEWQATINNRSNGRGCPICAKEKRKAGKKNTD